MDLLFSNVVLPGGMTGAQVAERARELRPTLKVFVPTQLAPNAIIHHGRLDKGVRLITKPFSSAELAVKVRDVLDEIIHTKAPEFRPRVTGWNGGRSPNTRKVHLRCRNRSKTCCSRR